MMSEAQHKKKEIEKTPYKTYQKNSTHVYSNCSYMNESESDNLRSLDQR